MAPQIHDNDDAPDLHEWLRTVPSFAADWPRGVLGCEATTAPLRPDVSPFHIEVSTDV